MSFNLAWVFDCLVTLSYPLVNGKNEYFFDHNLAELASRSSCGEGVFYFCELHKMLRFLESFFSFSALESEVFEQLVLQSGYYKLVGAKGARERCLVGYDRLLSLIRFAVLDAAGERD